MERKKKKKRNSLVSPLNLFSLFIVSTSMRVYTIMNVCNQQRHCLYINVLLNASFAFQNQEEEEVTHS